MTLVNGVLVQVPVKQSDIQGALGVSSSVNKWSQLCTHGNIKMWAKYKPVSYNTPANLTLEQRQNVNYGISNIPAWSKKNNNLVSMMYFWLQGNKTDANAPDCGYQNVYWSYQRPIGGSSSPYRALDFNGYYHDAVPPIQQINTSIEISPNGNLQLNYPNGAQNDYTLKYTDLKFDNGSQISLAGFYFGVALVKKSQVSQSNATKYVMTGMTATEAVELGAYVNPTFEDDSHLSSFMGNADSTQFYIMCFFANDEIYDTYTRTSGGTTTTYRKFLTSFNSVTANKFVALLERLEVTIVRKYVDVKVTYLTSAKRYGHTDIIDTSFDVSNSTTNYDVTITKMTLEYMDVNGVVLYTQELINSIGIRSGSYYEGNTSHNFGTQGGTANIDSVRMKVVTISNALSFRPSESVRTAKVTTPGPTPTPTIDA